MFQVKCCETFGRGLYSTQNIPKGTVIDTCEVLVLSEIDTMKLQNTDLKYYVFKYDETRDCLVLGHGELFNHSETPNVKYELVDFDGRKVMRFIALAHVPKGSQLFTNYKQDDESINPESYTVNLVETKEAVSV